MVDEDGFGGGSPKPWFRRWQRPVSSLGKILQGRLISPREFFWVNTRWEAVNKESLRGAPRCKVDPRGCFAAPMELSFWPLGLFLPKEFW